jgi:hypothetical protein
VRFAWVDPAHACVLAAHVLFALPLCGADLIEVGRAWTNGNAAARPECM